MKVDYSKTFIYKLCCRDPTITDIYVGHSTNFKQRNQKHKYYSSNINNKECNQYKYKFIKDNGGYENWILIKLYDYPCNNKREAEAEECKTMIELNATLNSMKSFATEEEKKETRKNWGKKRYENNKTEILEYQKEYRKNNKSKIKKYHKQYIKNNKTEINEKKKVKVKCEFCGFELQKNTLKTHQKSLKCMKFQEFIDLE